MTSVSKPTDAQRLADALALATAANDQPSIDSLPPAKPLGRTTEYAARVFGISARNIQDMLNAPKRPGKPKLWGFRIGKLWRVTDEALEKFADESQRVARGEKIP